MNNFIYSELPRKIRDLIREYDTFYSRRIEGTIDRTEFYPNVKEATIIIDCHSSDEFLKIALEETLKALSKFQKTHSTKYSVLLWTNDGIVTFKEKIKIPAIAALLPFEFPNRLQTFSSTLAEIKDRLHKSKFVLIISDGGFIYQTPKTDPFIYNDLKKKIIWVLSNWDNKDTCDSCLNTGFIVYKSIVKLNLKERKSLV